MLRRIGLGFGIVTACLLIVNQAAAQTERRIAVEGSAGYAGFLDDATIDHAVVGGGVRFYLTPRLSVGPEVTYMRGPGGDRDLFVTGNAILDLPRPRGTSPRIATPYLLVGGGWFQHSDRVRTGVFRSGEGALTGGGGVRVEIRNGVYVAPEFRIGWEPHYRVSVTIGYSRPN